MTDAPILPSDAERPDDDASNLAADALADLRAAWDALPVPEATPELLQTDATTRRTIDWMAAAWQQLPVPETVVPDAAHRRGRRAAPLLAIWRRHLAAAALLVGAGIAMHFAQSAETAPADPGAPTTVASTPPAFDEPQLVAATEDHVEFRSGSVRLVLVTSGPTDTDEPPQ